MPALTLHPGRPAKLSAEGRTLSVINDPTLYYRPEAGPAFDAYPGPSGTWRDLQGVPIWIGFDACPQEAGGAALVVPPFHNGTCPVPPGASTVFVVLATPAWPRAPLSRTIAAGAGGWTPLRDVTIGYAFTDDAGPLAVWAIGSTLSIPLLEDQPNLDSLPTGLPLDNRGRLLVPGPATPVYDQRVGVGGALAFFRPHLAPSCVSTARWTPAAANTLYPATLVSPPGATSSPFDATAPTSQGQAQVWARVIHKVILSIFTVPGSAFELVIGTSGLTVGVPPSGSELIRMATSDPGVFMFEFGEGIPPNWDGCAGSYQYYASAVPVNLDVMVIHG